MQEKLSFLSYVNGPRFMYDVGSALYIPITITYSYLTKLRFSNLTRIQNVIIFAPSKEG